MKESVTTIVLIYLVIMNVAGFASMGIDKGKAKKHERRISEKALLTVAALGGSLGSFAGMSTFRHKTKHIKFTVCVPLFLIIHIFVIGFLIWRFII